MRSVDIDARCSSERVDWVYAEDAAEEEDEDSFVRRWSLDAILLIMDRSDRRALRWDGVLGNEDGGEGGGDEERRRRRDKNGRWPGRQPLFSLSSAPRERRCHLCLPKWPRGPARPCSTFVANIVVRVRLEIRRM